MSVFGLRSSTLRSIISPRNIIIAAIMNGILRLAGSFTIRTEFVLISPSSSVFASS